MRDMFERSEKPKEDQQSDIFSVDVHTTFSDLSEYSDSESDYDNLSSIED